MKVERLGQKQTADFRSLIEIFKKVFEHAADVPSELYLSSLLTNPDFMAFVIKIDEEVVGGLTIYILHGYYSVKPVAYIYDVGIATKFQRMGLGKILMAEVCAFCKANGFDEAYVEAEAGDMDAVSFYRKTRFSHEGNAVHFTYSFKQQGQ